MSSRIGIPPRLRRLLRLLLPGLLCLPTLLSCSHKHGSNEETRVRLAFESCKSALIHHQTGQVMTYIPRNVSDYLDRLNASAKVPPAPPAIKTPAVDDSPAVTLLLRTALAKKVPADLRPTLTLDTLMQRVSDERLLDLRNVEEISLGPVSVSGSRASAEIYYQGTLTALRLPFLKEGNVWKIDVLAVLPYAEVLMRLDRAMTGQSETQQVEQLVKRLPSL